MALSIKTDEADALARELAAETDETLTEAVTVALRERLERVRRDRRRALGRSMRRLAAEFASTSVDERSADEIVAYDVHGAPA